MNENQKMVRTVAIAGAVVSAMAVFAFSVAMNGTGGTVSPAIEAMNNDSRGTPFMSGSTSLAPNSIDDLQAWYDAAGVQGIGGGERAHSFDRAPNTSVRQRLLLSGKIVQTASQSRVRILSEKGSTFTVELLDGMDKGTKGIVLKSDIWYPSSPSDHF